MFDWLIYCFAPVEFGFFRVLVKPVLKVLYPQEVAWDEFDWIAKPPPTTLEDYA